MSEQIPDAVPVIEISSVGIQGPAGPQGPQGVPGPPGPAGGPEGPSAYDAAVANGFTGTEVEWLESLQGSDGVDGESAYEIALLNGYIGTEGEWLDYLQGSPGATGPPGPQGPAGADGLTGPAGPAGADGAPGPAGIDGQSAYEVAVSEGFVGTEAEWLASLQGADGLPGPEGPAGVDGAPGPAGPAGPAGADGRSAYDIAVDHGFEGTEQEWLDSLGGGGTGYGIPAGGLTAQVLTKLTDADYDASWVDPPMGGSGYTSTVLPMTTVVSQEPSLVWSQDNEAITTEVPAQ